ncbi:MAG: hypothetical protein E7571_06160 [Ruminococcaceae bacterium]|nr:hypothetical protein [Oscillospiraceae bacterium]
MLYTVMNVDYVLDSGKSVTNTVAKRSTNPYDYIRKGWYLDNSVMYKGVNNVSLVFDYSGNIAGGVRDTADK